jgi:hypothetical protein
LAVAKKGRPEDRSQVNECGNWWTEH